MLKVFNYSLRKNKLAELRCVSILGMTIVWGCTNTEKPQEWTVNGGVFSSDLYDVLMPGMASAVGVLLVFKFLDFMFSVD